MIVVVRIGERGGADGDIGGKPIVSLTFYYASGSPYAWRVWLALERKQIPYEIRTLSFSAGDLKKPEFAALNPRRRVPVIVDDGFTLYESAAIVEYLDERYPRSGQPLFPADVRERAVARRLIREMDEYVAHPVEGLVGEILFKPREEWEATTILASRNALLAEFEYFERALADAFLAGSVGAADFTLYPLLALMLRLERFKRDLDLSAALGPKLSAWMRRVETLPYFAKTYPPHWKNG